MRNVNFSAEQEMSTEQINKLKFLTSDGINFILGNF